MKTIGNCVLLLDKNYTQATPDKPTLPFLARFYTRSILFFLHRTNTNTILLYVPRSSCVSCMCVLIWLRSILSFLWFYFHYRKALCKQYCVPKMAEDEQFSLSWNNFNSNLSAGFHESLCRGDLVDVTLAADGQLLKAHRLVLSVCSPYFRKMFTQMPANQHAFGKFNDCS